MTNQQRFTVALGKKGYTQEELAELSNVELRDLYEEEFPSVIHVVGMYRNGGTTRNLIPLTAKDNKKAA